jgi:hypothetical protein
MAQLNPKAVGGCVPIAASVVYAGASKQHSERSIYARRAFIPYANRRPGLIQSGRVQPCDYSRQSIVKG